MDIDKVIDMAKEAKQILVSKGGIGADLEPLLCLERDGRILASISLGNAVTGDDPNRVPLDFASAVFGSVALMAPDQVAVVVEAYSRTRPDSGAPEDLQARFADGDPDVTECLIVTRYTRDGYAFVHLPYRYDGRTVQWGEPDWPPEEEVDGFLVAALGAGMAAAADPATPKVGRAALLELLGTLGATTVIFTAKPGEPCACGSGLPFEQCHLAGLN
jgi:hypothetical protein